MVDIAALGSKFQAAAASPRNGSVSETIAPPFAGTGIVMRVVAPFLISTYPLELDVFVSTIRLTYVRIPAACAAMHSVDVPSVLEALPSTRSSRLRRPP